MSRLRESIADRNAFVKVFFSKRNYHAQNRLTVDARNSLSEFLTRVPGRRETECAARVRAKWPKAVQEADIEASEASPARDDPEN